MYEHVQCKRESRVDDHEQVHDYGQVHVYEHENAREPGHMNTYTDMD